MGVKINEATKDLDYPHLLDIQAGLNVWDFGPERPGQLQAHVELNACLAEAGHPVPVIIRQDGHIYLVQPTQQ